MTLWMCNTRLIAPSFCQMQVPVEVFAQYCHKKVEKMAQSGAKKGLKKPTLEEVMHAKVSWGWIWLVSRG